MFAFTSRFIFNQCNETTILYGNIIQELDAAHYFMLQQSENINLSKSFPRPICFFQSANCYPIFH